MNGCRKLLTFGFFVGLCSVPLPGQLTERIHDQLRFKHITIDDGLSNSRVISICQDSYGFIWFGSIYGLNKYDGYELTCFYHNDNDSLSLPHDRVEAVYCDSRKMLWIGTYSGLARFNYDNNSFVQFKHPSFPDGVGRVQDIAEDDSGALWLCTWGNGLIRYDVKNNTIRNWKYDPGNPNSIPDNTLTNIVFDQQHNIWMSTYDKGVVLMEKSTGKFTLFLNDPDNPASISEDRVESMYTDSKGFLWFGTYNNGLNQYDPISQTFNRYDPDSMLKGSGRVRAIFEDKKGNRWIGTQTGLYLFNLESGSFYRYAYTEHPFSTLSHNSIQCALIDNHEGLWLGTFAGGVSYTNMNSSGITLYEYSNLKSPYFLNDRNVYCFAEDAEGNIWVGTEHGGLNFLNRKTGLFTYFLPTPGERYSLLSDNIKEIKIDRNNNLWIATNAGGLNYYNTAKKQFTHFLYDPKDPNSLPSNDVYALNIDDHDNLWVGTRNGLCVKSPDDEGFLRINLPENIERTENMGLIEVIVRDHNGSLWGAGPGIPGILKLDPVTRDLVLISTIDSLSIGSFNEIHCDYRGFLWLGLNNNTLVRLSPDSMTYTQFGPAMGFPKIIVMAILDDNEGNLWVSSNDGLYCFYNLVYRQDSLQYKRFSRFEGLQSRQFIANSKMVSREGELFFGGVNGFNSFFPARVKENPYPPQLVFTDFRVNNKSVKVNEVVGGKRILKKSILETREIKINHRIKTFTIGFAGLHYVAPEQNRYAYKLEGFDDWNYVDASGRLAGYSNLPPGKYVFMVKASNNSGVWNEKPISLKINVKPPFWRTIWFYLLILVLLTALIATFITWREQRLKADKMILESKIREGEEELKARKDEIEKHQKMMADREKAEFEIRWFNDGLAKFSEILSKEKSNLNKLCHDLISNLTSYVEAIQGAIYILNNNDQENVFLELAAGDIGSVESREDKAILSGEGLVGACFKSKDIIEVRDVPDNYFKISSGLGSLKPGYLLLLPIKFDTDIEGVIELAAFKDIEPYKIHFIEKLAEMLVPIISSFKSNMLVEQMFARTREQSEELQAQEEELRQNMEEMRATQEESERIRLKLEHQVEELKQENLQLKAKHSGKKKH